MGYNLTQGTPEYLQAPPAGGADASYLTTDGSVPGGGGGPAVDPYDALILAHPDLRAYWPLHDAAGVAGAFEAGAGQFYALKSGTITTGDDDGPGGDDDTSALFGGGYFASGLAEGSIVDFSLEAWFKTTSAGNQFLIGGRTQSGSFSLFMGSHGGGGGGAGRLHAFLDDGGLAYGRYTNAAFNDGAWHHVVAIADFTSGQPITTAMFHVYVDGEAVGVSGAATAGNPGSAPFGSAGGLQLGANGTGQNVFAGRLSRVAAYAGRLADEDIAAHFAALAA